jgi:hypothetical protein
VFVERTETLAADAAFGAPPHRSRPDDPTEE